MSNTNENPESHQVSLSYVLDKFHYLLDAGEAISPDQLVAEYPHLASQLIAHFRRHGGLYSAVRNLENTSSLDMWSRSGDGGSAADNRGPAWAAALEMYELDAAWGESADAWYFRVHPANADDRDLLLAVGKWPVGDHAESIPALCAAADRLTSCQHPNLHRFHGLHERDGYLFSVCDFLAFPTLSQCLAVGHASWKSALELATQMADGVAVLHAGGVGHGNLHPDHVLMASKDRPVLTSYGLARLAFDWGSVPGGMATSAPAMDFLPPEVMQGGTASDPGPAQDVYSLGALLECMLALPGSDRSWPGQATVHTDPVEKGSAGGVPERLRDLCRQATAPRPEQRPADAGVWARQLRAVLE